jgi:hypothetical protein
MNLNIDETNIETIEKSFSRIANEILNEHLLFVGPKKYRVTAIEFYFYNHTNHKDENIHSVRSIQTRAKERQILQGKWYLHKISISPTYKRKGLDLTFGNGKNFGGILIKEIMDIDNNIKFTQSKLVDEFIKVLKPTSKEEFLDMIEKDDKVQLKKANIEKKEIISTPRKNLANDTFKDSNYAYSIKDI